MAIPKGIRERINKGLTKYTKIVGTAKQKKANEADTSTIVRSMLQDVLGYGLFEITAQYRIRGQYADYVIIQKEQPSVVVEVKAIGLKLNENHLVQSTTYAAQNGIEWAILTNAVEWQLYHLSFGKGIDKFLVFDIDLLSEEQKRNEKIEYLYAISKGGFTKGVAKKMWQERLALSTANLKKVILSDTVLARVKSELKNLTGQKVSVEDLRDILDKKLVA